MVLGFWESWTTNQVFFFIVHFSEINSRNVIYPLNKYTTPYFSHPKSKPSHRCFMAATSIPKMIKYFFSIDVR